jgi:hypothetical protein
MTSSGTAMLWVIAFSQFRPLGTTCRQVATDRLQRRAVAGVDQDYSSPDYCSPYNSIV